MRTVNVATDFSRYPAGRFKSDGPYSGEHFREDLLVPLLVGGETEITINLDGARGYGSSFLEEAFGGLVRKGYDPKLLLSVMKFSSNRDPSLIEEIQNYIKQSNE